MLPRTTTCRFIPQTFRVHATFRPITLTTARQMAILPNGDLNNTAAERVRIEIATDASYSSRSFAIPTSEDDPATRKTYRPFLLDDAVTNSDWIAQLELSTALKMVDTQIIQSGEERLRVLVLYGSMRQR
jgi:arsenical resistance protein ArsH